MWANKVWKQLFGFSKGDRVEVTNPNGFRTGWKGTIIYCFPRTHSLRYLVRFFDGSYCYRQEELEYLGKET